MWEIEGMQSGEWGQAVQAAGGRGAVCCFHFYQENEFLECYRICNIGVLNMLQTLGWQDK